MRQAFEFFRRYQLDLQIGFFNRSQERHGSTGTALAWATALLAGFAAAAGALGGRGGTALVVSAFLGIGVPILLSAAQSWQAANRDREKAAAYEKAAAALETIKLDLDAVRAGADRGEVAAVRDFVSRVHLVLTSENEAWVPAARK